ncbi:class II glutamine amidotransferase [Roseovarius rhodophyticola]|uniref:Class II glutamine amidotransferase n=1 Tax=Roseovarius rhodophyticola TaxID=3080827 RepID=A0ABZ2TH08_9RHOB|nr:class II glutamine amidotransferase [Roseovarius sp. W115]MDV2930756.1 class II glutamine amidotransferase [Roseovarius sp. W115]
MCRWAAYLGDPIFMADVISAPQNSLIVQSRMALESVTETNADGFGLAWYGHKEEPGIYHDVLPAWSDANLISLAEQVQTGLFLAHVRASTGTATSRDNCHPFHCGKMSFMHNGQVGGFGAFRKTADMMISDEFYHHRKGSTDSESLFLVSMSHGLQDNPREALERTVGEFERLSRAHGETPHIRMTAAISDGTRLYAVRYASDEHAPSLYYRKSQHSDGWTVVSEPFASCGDWQQIASGTFLTFEKDTAIAERFAPNA